MLTFGSLFSGIGGMDLGLERAGMACKWQIEIDDYCQKILTRHWPHVQKYKDVRDCGAHNLEPADLICGGFPCQDISLCNTKAVGITGMRSGLWKQFFRIINELRPKFVLIENVPALSFRGLDVVLKDLAAIGYDAQWQTISAWAFGSHHKRERLYIIAHLPNADGFRWERRPVADCQTWSNAQFTRLVRSTLRTAVPAGKHGRVSDGVSHRMDRLCGLGNAVVPQVAEYIGRIILGISSDLEYLQQVKDQEK